MEDSLAAYEAARIPGPVGRALDLGTGTGAGAREIRKRFADADVVGADLSAEMLAEARNLAPEITFVQADASDLPFDDESFDLVAHSNDPVPRRGGPGTAARRLDDLRLLVWAETPIWVEPKRLRAELEERGFTNFAELVADRGSARLPAAPAPIRLLDKRTFATRHRSGRPFFAVGLGPGRGGSSVGRAHG